MNKTVTTRPYTGPIEEGVLPLCEALNDIDGVITLWSCEGHPERPSPPFVTFFCSYAIAAQLDKMLQRASRIGYLKRWWWVRGNFDDNGVWRYTIESNDRIVAKRQLRFGIFSNWKSADMRHELARMAIAIRTEFSERNIRNESTSSQNEPL